MSLHNQLLDYLHMALEGDGEPDKDVAVIVFQPNGKNLEVRLPSLTARKRQQPSSEGRRRQLKSQLSNILSPGEHQ